MADSPAGFGFEVRAAPGSSGRARLGRLRTPHGEVPTPVFMPVGTQAAVKGLTPAEVRACGGEIVLANTYHLWLRPGPDLIAAHGGLHAFMGWDGPILTDSGGFQVFSLRGLRRVDDDGVTFRSHLDGSTRRLDPETAVAVQEALGSDIAMVLDECVPYPAAREEAEAAVRRTLRWAERCRAAHRRTDQALFAIVQGGTYTDLRAACARELVAMDFPGYALGSLSVGETLDQTRQALEATVDLLPADRPRYLMGVGSPDYVLEAVWYGIDMFDCVLPTRIARNGTALVLPPGLLPSETGVAVDAADLPEGRAGRLVVRNAAYARDLRPVDPSCACPCCRGFTRAYLRHLFHAGEMLGPRLLTLHNLHTMHRLVRAIRRHAAAGTLGELRAAFWSRATAWSARNRAAVGGA
jgi:queuine tRNA-ribosyltransferase